MVVMAQLSVLLYNSWVLMDALIMINKKLSVALFIVAFSLQLFSPVLACVENCHLRAQSCHLGGKHESNTHACPHSKAASRFATAAKSECDCAIQAHQPAAKETVFTLDLSRTEISKLSVADFDPSSKSTSSLLEARLHGPPLSLSLAGQNTFLLNSNLRI